jgi:hypothetical protein
LQNPQGGGNIGEEPCDAIILPLLSRGAKTFGSDWHNTVLYNNNFMFLF